MNHVFFVVTSLGFGLVIVLFMHYVLGIPNFGNMKKVEETKRDA